MLHDYELENVRLHFPALPFPQVDARVVAVVGAVLELHQGPAERAVHRAEHAGGEPEVAVAAGDRYGVLLQLA